MVWHVSCLSELGDTWVVKLAMGSNGAQDITPLSDDGQERDGESLTRRNYFCMRLVSEYLCLVETGAKMLATGGLQLSSVTNAAEEPQNWAWPGGAVPRLTRLCCLWRAQGLALSPPPRQPQWKHVFQH